MNVEGANVDERGVNWERGFVVYLRRNCVTHSSFVFLSFRLTEGPDDFGLCLVIAAASVYRYFRRRALTLSFDLAMSLALFLSEDENIATPSVFFWLFVGQAANLFVIYIPLLLSFQYSIFKWYRERTRKHITGNKGTKK